MQQHSEFTRSQQGFNLTTLKVKVVQDPTSVYEIDHSSKFEISMHMKPLNNPYLANMGYLRRPTNYLVKDARVLGMSNVIANSHGQAALENIVFNPSKLNKVIDPSETNFRFFQDTLQFRSTREIHVGKAVFIGGHHNYGHWLFNHIARLCFVDHLKSDKKYLVPKSMRQSQKDMLFACGIESEDLIFLEYGKTICVEELVIPQMPWHATSNGLTWWTPSCFSQLRSMLGLDDGILSKAKNRVFLTRKNTERRHIINEDEIFSSIKKFGFQRVDIGALSFAEQLELGKKTNILVTPIGANSNFFLNLPLNATVVELAPKMNSMNVTGPFSDATGLKYMQIVGQKNSISKNSGLNEDFFVDPAVIIRELDRIVDAL